MDGAFDLATLADAIGSVSSHILDYALVLAAVGTVTMALLELLKAVFRLRLFYHRNRVQRWIGNNPAVRGELLHLAAGGEENARPLYDQPSERLFGQLQAAGNVALDFPMVYPALYRFLTQGSARAGDHSDQDRWQRFAPRMAGGIPPDATARAAFEADSRESTQARARLGNLLTRKLDAFQTSMEYGWARLNQMVAVGGGAILLYLVLPAGDGSPQAPTGVPFLTRATLAVLGGLVAPFAKDVVTALSGLRTRQ